MLHPGYPIRKPCMKIFKSATIGSKLIIGFALMILLIVVTGVTGYLSIKGIEKNLDEIFSVK